MAGPCSVESEAQLLKTAHAVKGAALNLGLIALGNAAKTLENLKGRVFQLQLERRIIAGNVGFRVQFRCFQRIGFEPEPGRKDILDRFENRAGLWIAGVGHQHDRKLPSADIFFHQQGSVLVHNAGAFPHQVFFVVHKRTVINAQAIPGFIRLHE